MKNQQVRSKIKLPIKSARRFRDVGFFTYQSSDGQLYSRDRGTLALYRINPDGTKQHRRGN